MNKFLIGFVLRKLGAFDRFPQLHLRGRFRHPIHPLQYVNHSQGRITSTTTKAGPVSRNSRTGKTTYDLPGPLKWVTGGKGSR